MIQKINLIEHINFSFYFYYLFLQGCSSGGPDSAKYPSIPKEIGQDFLLLMEDSTVIL